MDLNAIDRKGLIREAYRIDGITLGECRSIFLDWALNLSSDHNNQDAIAYLLEAYSKEPAAHPMNEVLHEGLAKTPTATRRGGRKARLEENKPHK
ncbi:MAG: hypothetical protein ABJN34_01310 [Litoreibacter sp.]|uniref:hypothetical protein n=1 Tax=Litoreibacter sp. TaxID=1969459 RepID=UPI003299DD6C